MSNDDLPKVCFHNWYSQGAIDVVLSQLTMPHIVVNNVEGANIVVLPETQALVPNPYKDKTAIVFLHENRGGREGMPLHVCMGFYSQLHYSSCVEGAIGLDQFLKGVLMSTDM